MSKNINQKNYFGRKDQKKKYVKKSQNNNINSDKNEFINMELHYDYKQIKNAREKMKLNEKDESEDEYENKDVGKMEDIVYRDPYLDALEAELKQTNPEYFKDFLIIILWIMFKKKK